MSAANTAGVSEAGGTILGASSESGTLNLQMSPMVKQFSKHFAFARPVSALPPKADMCGALAYVCFGPPACPDASAHARQRPDCRKMKERAGERPARAPGTATHQTGHRGRRRWKNLKPRRSEEHTSE